MIGLSARLRMNVDLVPEGASVADVGCDHGYVSIFLAANKSCHCIAMDIRKGPLETAKNNIKKYLPESEIECRLSDGLEALAPGEADTLVIGGMGGMLMSRILRQRLDVMSGIDTIVLQPQSDWQEVRICLHELGFVIEKESCVVDGGKFYLAVKAVRGKEHLPYSETENYYGRYLSEIGDSCYYQYLIKERDKNKKICETLSGQNTKSSQSRICELLHRINMLEEVLEKW